MAGFSFADLRPVEIDPTGIFKYILVVARAIDGGSTKMLVRGTRRDNIDYKTMFEDLQQSVNQSTVQLICKGGGKLDHDPRAKKIHVYGSSTNYGRPDHKQCMEVLKAAYPEYKITYEEEFTDEKVSI